MQQKEKELQIVFCNSLIPLVSRAGIEPANLLIKSHKIGTNITIRNYSIIFISASTTLGDFVLLSVAENIQEFRENLEK